MKRTFILIAVTLITLFPFAGHAQYNFPLAELEKLTNKNLGDFDTYVMEKDYSLDTKASTQVLKIYRSDKPSADGKINKITRYQVPNAVCRLEFSSTDKKYYLDVKSKLAAMGFKLVNDEVKTINGVQGPVYHYSNGPFQLALTTYNTDTTWYVVEVHA